MTLPVKKKHETYPKGMNRGAVLLRDFLDDRGMTARTLATKLFNGHEANLSHILRGRRCPTLHQAVEINTFTGGLVPVAAWTVLVEIAPPATVVAKDRRRAVPARTAESKG